MRGRGALPGDRLAGLDGDDGLALLQRAQGGALKHFSAADGFAEQRDHCGIGIIDQEVHVLGHGEVGLVARGDDVAVLQALARAVIEDRKPHAAALRHHRDTLVADVGNGRFAPYPFHGRTEGRVHAVDGVEVALAIRPGDAHAGAPGQRRHRFLHLGGFAALFREAGRDHDNVLHACCGAALQFRHHHIGGNGHQREVQAAAGILRRRPDIRIALDAVDVLVTRIDRIELALEATGMHEVEQFAADLGLVGRGADDGDGLRFQERMQRVLLVCSGHVLSNSSSDQVNSDNNRLVRPWGQSRYA